MIVPLAVAAAAVLLAVSVLAALSRALVEVGEAALERELAGRGSLERGRWILGRIPRVEWSVAFVRTAGRISFTVLVIAIACGFDEPMTPARLAAAWAVSLACLWLLTTAAASAFARHDPAGVIAAFLPTLRLIYVPLGPVRAVADLVDGAARRILAAPSEEVRREEELADAIEENQRQGLIDEQSAEILGNAVAFAETAVGAVMTPRPAIEGIAYTDDLAVIRDFVRRSGHSRIPVYRGSLDHVEGILYVKDLVPLLGAPAEGFELRRFLRPPHRVPESKPIGEQLRDFRDSKVHFALVVDEFGGTSGIVTIEDLIEELVGEIRDEHEPASDSAPPLRRLPDGSVEASGRATFEELCAALGTDVPGDEGYSTVAGFVLHRLGSIPREGAAFEHAGIRIEVTRATPSAVVAVRAARA